MIKKITVVVAEERGKIIINVNGTSSYSSKSSKERTTEEMNKLVELMTKV